MKAKVEPQIQQLDFDIRCECWWGSEQDHTQCSGIGKHLVTFIDGRGRVVRRFVCIDCIALLRHDGKLIEVVG